MVCILLLQKMKRFLNSAFAKAFFDVEKESVPSDSDNTAVKAKRQKHNSIEKLLQKFTEPVNWTENTECFNPKIAATFTKIVVS